ncbi:hypothetical protein QR680_010623 [Steinernema hermaphroditum]|uniref:UPAR/Ly6 domain-containing protein n=1 Tax=Steinernema hermaphroditum TaxID=289476 RepID=A0AA39IQT3_9BILA|nr:hypothetical protein QR680_010623 [Steinernema hermaphroditum]
MKISPTLLGLCVAVSIVASARSELRCHFAKKNIEGLDEVSIIKSTVECPVKQCIAIRRKEEVVESLAYGCFNASYTECGDGENILPKLPSEKRKKATTDGVLAMYCCNKTLCNESLEKTIRNGLAPEKPAPSTSAPSSSSPPFSTPYSTTPSSSAPSCSTLSPTFIELLIFFGVFSAFN